MPRANVNVNAIMATKRRALLCALGATALAATIPVRAQPSGKVWRIGILSPRALPAQPATDPAYRSFLQSLQEQGFTDGKNVAIEWRQAEGKYERLGPLADELVKAGVDLIFAPTPPSIAAAKKASTTIPIVMVAVGDPVALGFVASFNRPGGNITGVSNQIDDVSSKYLELLRLAIPKLQRVAALVNPDNPNFKIILNQIEASAKVMGIEIVPVQANSAEQINQALNTARQGRAQAVIVQADGFFSSQRRQIIELTTKHRLASMWWTREPVEAGALMSYGPNVADDYRKAGLFVARILKGAKAADLPIEQPTILKFTLNKKTAAALGIKIPPELLLRADEVIE